MTIETQLKLKSNPLYTKYLHENSYWYKILTRDPNKFSTFVDKVKTDYKLWPSDKIDRAFSTLEMITAIVSTLNSK